MKRVDIDRALAEIVTRSGDAAHDPLARPEEQTAAKSLALLAVIVGEQEQRIRALERCPANEGRPHVWLDSGICGFCEVYR